MAFVSAGPNLLKERKSKQLVNESQNNLLTKALIKLAVNAKYFEWLHVSGINWLHMHIYHVNIR